MYIKQSVKKANLLVINYFFKGKAFMKKRIEDLLLPQEQEQFNELALELLRPDVDITDEMLQNTVLYQRINEQQVQEIDCHCLWLPHKLLLMAKIAAVSPSVHAVYMSGNTLGEYGIKVAKVLATSPNINTVDISRNELKEHGPAVAENLAQSSSIHTVYMGNNGLEQYGPAVAGNLARSHSIHTVYMSANDLGKYGPVVAENLAKSSSIHTVYMSDNDLGKYGPAVVENLANSPSIHTIGIRCNKLGKYGIEVANILAASHIHSVDIRCNSLHEHLLEVANILATSPTIRAVGIGGNYLGGKFTPEARNVFSGHNKYLNDIKLLLESGDILGVPDLTDTVVGYLGQQIQYDY